MNDSDAELEQAPQGKSDWTREAASDDLLSDEVRRRLEQYRQAEAALVDEEQLIDEP